MKHGATIIRDADLRRLRALAMVERRIHGASIPALAKEFNMSEVQVQRVLSYAKKANLLVEAEDRVLQELVPDSIELLKRFLTPKELDGKPLPISDKDAAIALRLLEGVLPAMGKKQGTGKPTPEDDDIYAYVDRIRKDMVIDGAATSTPVIEGQIQALLPAAPESPSEQGVSTSTGQPDAGATPSPSSPSGEERHEGN